MIDYLREQPELLNMPLAVYTVNDLTEADREQLQLGPTLLATKGVMEPDEFARSRGRTAQGVRGGAGRVTPQVLIVDDEPDIREIARASSRSRAGRC